MSILSQRHIATSTFAYLGLTQNSFTLALVGLSCDLYTRSLTAILTYLFIELMLIH